jgi:cysteine-rich repeat protein
VVDAFEECDGPNAGPQPRRGRHHERCGNGIIDNDPDHAISEQCDDHNTTNGDGCSASCRFEFCGDGTSTTARCDRVASPATCNIDCTPSTCGDGKLNPSAVPPEQCDDGARFPGDGCSVVCSLEHCGNNVLDAFEECDGPDAGLQPCAATCQQERCGNGILDRNPDHSVNEQCDDRKSPTATAARTTASPSSAATASSTTRGLPRC